MPTPIEVRAEILLDEAKAERDVQQFARDTKVKLDKVKLIKFEGDVSDLQFKTDILRKKLRELKKEPVLDEKKIGQVNQALNRTSSNLTEAKRRLQNFRNTGDEATSRLQKKFDGLGKSVKKSLSGIKSSLAGIIGTIGVGAGIGNIFGSAKDLEQTRIALNTIIGDTEKAGKLVQDISKFGADTPFDFPELANASKQLLAFGEGADNIIPVLSRIGDISAGVSQPIGEIAEIYGKARVQGRLFAEDINQLTGRGIPIIGELASQFGIAESEVKKLVESGAVTFENLEQAFVSLTEEGGKFSGLMEAQSESVGGALSNLADNFGIVARAVFGMNEQGELIEGGILQKIRDLIIVTTEALGKFKDWAAENPKLSSTLGLIAAAIGGLVVIGGTLGVTLGAITFALLPVLKGLKALRTAIIITSVISKKFAVTIIPSMISALSKYVVATLAAAAKTTIAWVAMGAKATVQAARIAGAWLLAFGPIAVIVAAVVGLGVVVYKNWDLIVAKTNELKVKVIQAFGELTGGIKNKFDSIVSDARQWGVNMISMLIDGMLSGVGRIGDAAKSLATSIWENIGFGSPTKKGPGKDSDKWMPNMIGMLKEGIMKGKKSIGDASAEIAQEINNKLGYVDPNIDSIKQISEKLNEEKKKVDAEIKQIADVLGKEIDSPEVQDVYNELLAKREEIEQKEKELIDNQKQYLEDLEQKNNDVYTTASDSAEEYAEKVRETNDELQESINKIVEFGEEAADSVREINNEISNLNKDEDQSIAERALEIEEDRRKVLEDIGSEKLSQIDSELEGELSDAKRLRLEEKRSLELEKIARNLESDTRKTLEQTEALEKLNGFATEQELIQSRITQELIDQKKAFDELTETEQLIQENSQKREGLEQEKLVQEAVTQNRRIVVEEDSEGIKAFVENEKGELVELNDFKLALKAQELEEERTQLENKTNLLRVQLADEVQILRDKDQDLRDLESSFTFFLSDEVKNRTNFQKGYNDELRKTIALLKQTGVALPDVSGNASVGSQNVTNSKEVNITQTFNSEGGAEAGIQFAESAINQN